MVYVPRNAKLKVSWRFLHENGNGSTVTSQIKVTKIRIIYSICSGSSYLSTQAHYLFIFQYIFIFLWPKPFNFVICYLDYGCIINYTHDVFQCKMSRGPYGLAISCRLLSGPSKTFFWHINVINDCACLKIISFWVSWLVLLSGPYFFLNTNSNS